MLGEAKESRSKRKGKKKGKRGETGSIRPRLKVSERFFSVVSTEQRAAASLGALHQQPATSTKP